MISTTKERLFFGAAELDFGGGTCCNADVETFGDGKTSSLCKSGLVTSSLFRSAEKFGTFGMRPR